MSVHVTANLEAVYEVFGQRLRQARLKKGLTLTEVARKLSGPRSSTAVANIEAGRQRFQLHLAAELASAVGADLGELCRPSAKRAAWEALGE